MIITTASTLPSCLIAAPPNSAAMTPSPTESKPDGCASASSEFARDCSRKALRAKTSTKGENKEYWVRATLVEALLGLGNTAKSEAEFAIAKNTGPKQWMINTTQEQLAKLRALQR